MMPLHSYFVIPAFIFLGLLTLLHFSEISFRGMEIMGKLPIDRYYFFSGKLTLLINWTLFLLKALFPKLGYLDFPEHVSWIATGMLWTGTIIIIVSFATLGSSLRIGVPGSGTDLKTKGIYGISRNPMFIGMYTIAIGSCLYFPDLINVSFTIYGIVIHTRIIKGEEIYLKERFGEDWIRYCQKVKRYI
jgi:protein-S-isoprenylcysteine O-methyltransferase Ste14